MVAVPFIVLRCWWAASLVTTVLALRAPFSCTRATTAAAPATVTAASATLLASRRRSRPPSALWGEMRIRIHGTKNAYTTLRPYDCVLYLLATAVDGKDRRIGAYLPTKEIAPLCNHEEFSTEFYLDRTAQPLSADALNAEGKVLRVVSADRRGADCFVVDEYIDSDVFIPVHDPNAPPSAAPGAPATPSPLTPPAPLASLAAAATGTSLAALSPAELDSSIAVAQARLDASLLQLQLAELHAERTRRAAAAASTATAATAGAAAAAGPTSSAPVAVATDLAPAAVGPYAQAVVANGFVFVSGCISLDVSTGRIAEGGPSAETRAALNNLLNILKAACVNDLSKVVKTTLMVRELEYFPEVNKVYAEYFTGDVKPARSTFEVSYLPLGAFIEVDAVAAL